MVKGVSDEKSQSSDLTWQCVVVNDLCLDTAPQVAKSCQKQHRSLDGLHAAKVYCRCQPVDKTCGRTESLFWFSRTQSVDKICGRKESLFWFSRTPAVEETWGRKASLFCFSRTQAVDETGPVVRNPYFYFQEPKLWTKLRSVWNLYFRCPADSMIWGRSVA